MCNNLNLNLNCISQTPLNVLLGIMVLLLCVNVYELWSLSMTGTNHYAIFHATMLYVLPFISYSLLALQRLLLPVVDGTFADYFCGSIKNDMFILYSFIKPFSLSEN